MSDPIADTILVMRDCLQGLVKELPAESATAKGALNSAVDAVGAFERNARLISYEGKRQSEIAARRAAKAEAEAKAKAAEQAARDEKRHAAVLVAAGERMGAEAKAKEFFQKKGTSK